MITLVLVPLPAPVPALDALPAAAVARVTADVSPGFPCRRCLQDAAVGEQLVLLAYDPFRGSSPYRQPGPVYLHERDCAPVDSLVLANGVPEQLARRVLSVRAFDADHLMVDAVVSQGSALTEAAERLFASPRVDYLHVHNAGPGCFAVRIVRGPRGADQVG